MNIEVYTDGSATTADKPGGYGWVLVVDGEKHSEGNGHLPLASNNDAELEAAIQGLKAAFDFANSPIHVLGRLEAIDIVPPTVTLVSDSEIILGWTNGTYRFKQENKIDKFNHLQRFVKTMNVQTRWVEGHTGDEHNERCDKLANAARLGIDVDAKPQKAPKKKREFRWNELAYPATVWDTTLNKAVPRNQTVKEFISKPGGACFEDVARALCLVVAELIELEEERERKRK